MMFPLCICLLIWLCQIKSTHIFVKFPYTSLIRWRSLVLAPQLFALGIIVFVFAYNNTNECHQTHSLTHWILLLVCLGWALSLGWWFVTHSLCTLNLAPNLSLQTLPQTSILSPLWPFLFLPSLFLSWVLLPVTGRDADAVWQGTECVQDFMFVLFLVDTLDKRLLWAGCAESWCAMVEFARGLLQVSYSAVWLNKTERSYISSKCCHAHRHLVSIREKKRSLGFWVFVPM